MVIIGRGPEDRPGAARWRHVPALVGAALVVLAVGACVEPPPEVEQVEQAAVVCPAGTTLPGIDVSYWQGAINWNQVAGAGIRFAIIRVSDGTTTIDNRFGYNWSEARRVGITRGAYQFFRPNQSASAQANLLLSIMGPLQSGDLPPTIDVEATGGMSPAAIASRIQTWVDIVRGATGMRPIIYTGKYFWQDNVQSAAFSNYPLWIAHWGVTCPNIPFQWSNWVFHQYTDSGQIPGISGYVDRNRFNGNAAALAAMTVSNCQCNPGQTQTQSCGNCGTRSRTCQPSCQWGSWSACVGQGVCSPGTTQSRDCCDCGSQSRTCGGNCQWQPWSACAGPDPQGGTLPCDTGEPGPCAEGRWRCVEGCLACIRIVDPEPERCDTVDNDCDGRLNNGDPEEMGIPPPPWAARQVDLSLPQALVPGEVAPAWVTFENVGSEAWPAHELWLKAEAAAAGEPSPFHHLLSWPAHDVAAFNLESVPPGETCTLELWLAMPPEASEAVTETFRLEDPFGAPVACPSPTARVRVLVGRRPEAPVGPADQPRTDAPTTSNPPSRVRSGCATGSSAPGLVPLLLFLVGLGWRLRRKRR